MEKLFLPHQDTLIGARSTLPRPSVAKLSSILDLHVYCKTTTLINKPRWNINALSGLIPSMRATGAQKHTSQSLMSLLVHVWWNPFTCLPLIALTCMLAYLMLLIKLFWYIVTEPPYYTRLSRKIIQWKDNLTNLSPYNPVVREISTDFKPFHIIAKIVLSLVVTIISYINVRGIKYIGV
jgi:hypothetical protein